MKARSCVTLPGADPPPSPSPPSLSRPPTLPLAGAEGTSPLPCRGVRPPFVVAPLPILVAHVLLPDPRDRPRVPFVLLPPSTAPVDIDAVALDVAGVTLGRVRGARECPGAVTCLFLAVEEFPVATDTAPLGSVCSLLPASPSDAKVAPPGGVTPAAKGSLSLAGAVPSAVPLTAAGVALG